MKKFFLIRKFAAYSLFAFIISGAILSFIIAEHVKNEIVKSIEEYTKFTISTTVRNNFVRQDFDAVIQEPKSTEIIMELLNSMSIYNINFITLISNSERIVLSNDPDFRYEQIQTDSLLDQVLQAKLPYAVTKINKSYSSSLSFSDNPVLRIYEPVRMDGQIVGVFILHIPYEVVSSHSMMIVRIVALTLSGGLIGLFLLLVGILYRTSRTLLTQNEVLARQNFEIGKSLEKLNSSYKSMVIALSNAVDARDPYTAGHSSRVAKIASQLGSAINLSEREQKTLEFAALFHDIGKLGIPDSILNKAGKLTSEEFALIKKHPVIGTGILEHVDFLEDVMPIIRHHHERYEGNGYPDGISKEEIPLGSRILAIADTYDAMTSDRPYRKGMGHIIAIQEIANNRGIQFDAELVDVFLNIMSKSDDTAKKAGSQL